MASGFLRPCASAAMIAMKGIASGIGKSTRSARSASLPRKGTIFCVSTEAIISTSSRFAVSGAFPDLKPYLSLSNSTTSAVRWSLLMATRR